MNKKRAGVFVFFDKEGVVDRYVEYLLEDMRKCLDHLCIVVNGSVNGEGCIILERFADSFHIRENKGLDAYSYKEGILNYIGIEKLRSFDELIIFNDTFYGPFYSFSYVFEEMDKNEELDFWGLTKGYPAPANFKYYLSGYYPEHIQSFFVAFRQRMFTSDVFIDYWEKMPLYKNFDDVVMKHETYFAQYFAEKGFKWDVFCKTDDLQETEKMNTTFYAAIPYELIRDRGANFLKRKNFTLGRDFYLNFSTVYELDNAINYIENNCDYDVNMIYDNLLRLYGSKVLRKTADFTKAIYPGPAIRDNYDDVSFVFHLEDMVLLPRIQKLLNDFPCSKAVILSSVPDLTLPDVGVERLLVDDNHSAFKLLKSIENELGHYIVYLEAGAKDVAKKTKLFGEYEYNWEGIISDSVYLKKRLDCFVKYRSLGLIFSPLFSGEKAFDSFIIDREVLKTVVYETGDYSKAIIDGLDACNRLAIEAMNTSSLRRQPLEVIITGAANVNRTWLGKLAYLVRIISPDWLITFVINIVPPSILNRMLYGVKK